MAKTNERKVLGHDPFANGDNILAEEGVGVLEDPAEKLKVEAKMPPPVEAEEESKVETKPKTEKKAAAKPPGEKKATTKAEVKSEAEPALEQIVAEPDEEATHLLDELMATIDEEVEKAFGPGTMADLAPAEAVGAAGEEQFVIFSLAGSDYAVPAANVREIGEPPNVTPVPSVPDWVLGVTNLRGDVLSLVDLSLFLSMGRADYNEDTRVMVVYAQQDASNVTTGLIVDRVSDIRYLSVNQIVVPAAPIEDQVAPYLRGVYEHDGHLVAVLNLNQLLLSPEMRQFESV